MRCPDCKGTGRYTGFTTEEDCATCHGTGEAVNAKAPSREDAETIQFGTGARRKLVELSNPDREPSHVRELLEPRSQREFRREYFNQPFEQLDRVQCGREIPAGDRCHCQACHIFNQAKELIAEPRSLTVRPSAEANYIWLLSANGASTEITMRELLLASRGRFIREKLVALDLLKPGQCCYRDHDADGNCDRHPRNLVREAFENINGGPVDPAKLKGPWPAAPAIGSFLEFHDMMMRSMIKRFGIPSRLLTPPPPADPASQTASAGRPA